MKIKPLIEKIDTDNFLSQYLKALGIKDVEKYLKGNNFENPWGYPYMDIGVKRLNRAILNNEKIGILLDEDTDGLCSSTIIYQFIKTLNPQQDIFMLFHVNKVHGLVQDEYENIVQQSIDSNIKLLITPDSSTNNVQECKVLKENGIDILILDHHELEQENPYAIVINHHLGDNLNIYLSGTGVTYQFIRAYCEYYNVILKNEYIDLVAVSLVSDICNMLSEENYSFFKKGLNNLTNPMLIKLFDKFSSNEITCYTIAWQISPKINAVFRTNNTEIKKAMFYAFAENNNIDDTIEMIKTTHEEQVNMVKNILKNIKNTLDEKHKVIIGFNEEKYRGYSGLIANKLLGEYKKPVIILREMNDIAWTGSMRSPIDLAEQINKSDLAKCQGHNSACGICIQKNKLNNLIEWFDKQDLNIETIEPVTACITPFDVTLELCEICSGNKFLWHSNAAKISEPTFYIEFESNNNFNVFKKKNNTVKYVFGDVEIIKFKVKNEDVSLLKKKKCKIKSIAKLNVNVWNGIKKSQILIDKWEIEVIENSEYSILNLW